MTAPSLSTRTGGDAGVWVFDGGIDESVLASWTTACAAVGDRLSGTEVRDFPA